MSDSLETMESSAREHIEKCLQLEMTVDDLRADKEDLNKTCVILERKLLEAETAKEIFVR